MSLRWYVAQIEERITNIIEMVWTCTQQSRSPPIPCIEGLQVQMTRIMGRQTNTLNKVVRKNMMDCGDNKNLSFKYGQVSSGIHTVDPR